MANLFPMQDVAKLLTGISKAISEELPLCKKCRCNWPKKNINADGLCPNCVDDLASRLANK